MLWSSEALTFYQRLREGPNSKMGLGKASKGKSGDGEPF
jgi:hypothetical protein